MAQCVAYPDSLVGTDSHTTMINGLGVLGWGVGGIEAEAAMLGQPISMLLPQVVGFKLTGKLPEGATATDAVLTVTQMLRAKGVVGKFVEFYGEGMENLALPDRATIANMAPEYGATMGFFPVDNETLAYLRFSGRDASHVDIVERVLKEQGLFHTASAPEPRFTDTLTLDLGDVVPSIAGPKRPQDRIALSDSKRSFQNVLEGFEASAEKGVEVTRGDETFTLKNGAVGHRRDHELHEHFEPFGHVGRRPGREEGRREGASDQALGEDEPRAWVPGRHRVPQGIGPDRGSRQLCASIWSVTVARRASATPVHSTLKSQRRSKHMAC